MHKICVRLKLKNLISRQAKTDLTQISLHLPTDLILLTVNMLCLLLFSVLVCTIQTDFITIILSL